MFRPLMTVAKKLLDQSSGPTDCTLTCGNPRLCRLGCLDQTCRCAHGGPQPRHGQEDRAIVRCILDSESSCELPRQLLAVWRDDRKELHSCCMILTPRPPPQVSAAQGVGRCYGSEHRITRGSVDSFLLAGCRRQLGEVEVSTRHARVHVLRLRRMPLPSSPGRPHQITQPLPCEVDSFPSPLMDDRIVCRHGSMKILARDFEPRQRVSRRSIRAVR